MKFEMMPIIWKDEKLFLLDQRKLPLIEEYLEINNLSEARNAIIDMVVRGAPCIGFTAIFGLALYLKRCSDFLLSTFRSECDFLISARPTAVNLRFEVERVFQLVKKLNEENKSVKDIFDSVLRFGEVQLKLSHEKHLVMAKIASDQMSSIYGDRSLNLMTHCNTGYLACGSLGTALGVISFLKHQNRINHVFVDETRPYLQGSRLTAYELMKENISHEIVVEGAASYIMSNNKIDAIFVGADRIALNGDTANKIGTSTLAIVAKYYKVPFYVVAPISSFDLATKSGKEIEIEMRNEKEITEISGTKISHPDCKALNPSFDVTDNELITGIICENGFIDPRIPGEVDKVVRGK